MQTFLNDFLAQVKGIWSRLDAGQRLVVVAVMVATVVGFGGIVWYAGRPSYEIVRTATNSDDIGKIQRALQQAGVAYDVDDSGRTFLVERSKIGVANMALAQVGLDGGSAGSFSTSIIDDAETKAFKLNNASIAMAQSAILKLDGVLGVTVTASAPKRRAAFRDRDEETRPSATVTLRVRPGATFEGLARSAASLAASQLMIPVKNIEVFSSTGSQRYQYDPDRDAGGGSSEFLAMQRGMARDRTSRAQELLDRMWPGQASVSVTVELDPQWEVRSEKVLPTEQIVKSEKTVKDSTDNSRPDTAATESGATTSTNTKKNETKDREFVTEIGERRTGKMAPDIRRMTVAVFYDKTLEEQDGWDPNKLGSAVKAIVGWDSDRDKDDAFSMLATKFEPVDEGELATASPGFADLALRWGPTIGQILGVIVVVMFLRGLFKRSGSKSPAAALGQMGGATLAGAGGATVDVNEDDLPPEDQQKRMRREIERSIASDPAALAKLLESWLLEQKA